ncbi:MAG: RadC family protein [Pseudomonadota bacterium]
MHKQMLIKDARGRYRVQGSFLPDDLVRVAINILKENLSATEIMSNPVATARFLQLSLAQEKNEHFAVLFLTTQHHLIRFETLFTGTLDGASVYPRVVVQKALEHNAGAVIFAHNHPSGACEPSLADRQITRRLVDALSLIDVLVLDHFVVSQTGWVSFAERGLL